MSNKVNISFGDNVKILTSPETDALGLTGKIGQVYGVTTPSVTSVEVIGSFEEDCAINVSIEGVSGQYWFSPNLLELIGHAESTEIIIGNHKAVRRADGSWCESVIKPNKK